MPQPTYVATGTLAAGTGPDLTPTIPVEAVADDLLILILEQGGSDPAPAAPTGWTLHDTQTSGPSTGPNTGTRGTVYWKIATGTDPDPTVGPVGNHGICGISAFRGTDTTTPFNADSFSIQSVNDRDHELPALTTTVDLCLIVHTLHLGESRAFSSPSHPGLAAPSITLDFTNQTGAGHNGAIGQTSGGFATAGNTGVGNVRSAPSDAQSVIFGLALQEPSVGPITGEADLVGTGTLTADGETTATGAADLFGTGTLTADGTIGIPSGQADLTGTGILIADGTAILPIIGEADLQGVGILTAQSLPPLSILTIRQLLAEGIRQSLHQAGRDDVAVYEYPPETVVVPSVVIMPDEPYWVPSNFGRSPLERIRVNLELQMLTPRLEMSESFNDLERLGGIVLQGTLRVPVVQWTEMGQPEGVTVNDIETIMTRASVMAHV